MPEYSYPPQDDECILWPPGFLWETMPIEWAKIEAFEYVKSMQELENK
jgi:hypothetical protein